MAHLLEKPLQTYHKNSSKRIVLGTGLSCETGCSLGTPPFDVLGIISSAEKIRNTLGYKGIIHFIDDERSRFVEGSIQESPNLGSRPYGSVYVIIPFSWFYLLCWFS